MFHSWISAFLILVLPETGTKTGVNGEYPFGDATFTPGKGWERGSIVAVHPEEKDYRNHDSKEDSSEPEMVLVRIGGKWQYITREMLEQARKVMRALEPSEREVPRLKFGLPPEYFHDFDKL